MQNRYLFTALVLCALALAPPPVQGSNCPLPCEPERCAEPSLCSFGEVTDPCGCCLVCGVGPGEQCGLYQTACGTGLVCNLREGSQEWNSRCMVIKQ